MSPTFWRTWRRLVVKQPCLCWRCFFFMFYLDHSFVTHTKVVLFSLVGDAYLSPSGIPKTYPKQQNKEAETLFKEADSLWQWGITLLGKTWKRFLFIKTFFPNKITQILIELWKVLEHAPYLYKMSRIDLGPVEQLIRFSWEIRPGFSSISQVCFFLH